MCLRVYLGCDNEIPLVDEEYIHVEAVPANEKQVEQWFDCRCVYFVGSHLGCSCGFPSVSADKPVEYRDGMFKANPNHADDLKSVDKLVELLHEIKPKNVTIKLYPVWFDELGREPKGIIPLYLKNINTSRFFFNERFMYVLK
jgi:hypothetical protein